MSNFLNTITKSFILNEAKTSSPLSYLQSLTDLVETIKPKSKRDANRLSLAKEQVGHLRRHFRRMEEKISHLEEKLNLLEEKKESR
jgi:septation ring formation regulator EzrA